MGERGYGYAYQKLRKALLPAAYGTPCVRCGQPRLPGQKLHLNHDDYYRTKLRGFAHAECNIRAAARKARAKTDRGETESQQASTPMVNASRLL
jgi:hypothetical protein